MSIIEQNFRMVSSINKMSSSSGLISKRYDEPTYLSFKLHFGISDNKFYNDVSESTSFDYMPHPLFQTPEGSSDEYLYSAVTYLRNINELERAEMLLEFIDIFNTIQHDYQWYFNSISGVDGLFSIDPKRGKRTAQDASIEIKCLDSLDRRMYYLFSLYRKIAWDDTYQRWILPDMMRFFTMTIFITEFRHFHQPYNTLTNSYVENTNGNSNSSATSKNLIKSLVADLKDAGTNFLEKTFPTYSLTNNSEPIVLRLMDNIFPTHIIKCEMCEFDINSFNCPQYSTLSVSESPNMCEFVFKVRVGNVTEKTNYPLFNRMLSDIQLNNNRTSDVGYTNLSTKDSSSAMDIVKLENNMANDISHIPLSKHQHGSGEYFHESKSITDDPLNTSHTKAWINKNMYLNNSTVINRMLNNATSFGVAKLENIIKDSVEGLKITEFKPGLSFNSIQSMISSGDVISSLGMIRRSLNDTYESNMSGPPSAKLDEMIDTAFMGLMEEYTKATVSLNEEPLQNAAKKALIDASFYDKIKEVSQTSVTIDTNISIVTDVLQREIDFSKTTDMTSVNEKNVYKTNINKDSLYREMQNKQVSKATNSNIVFEGKPSN